MAAMSREPPYTKALLRGASRIAGRLNPTGIACDVETSEERADWIDAAAERTLAENIEPAETMGAEAVQLPAAMSSRRSWVSR